MSQPDMSTAARQFFRTPHFAVVGASQDPSKFGHRILSWYAAHNLPVTPINPKTSSIAVGLPESSRQKSRAAAAAAAERNYATVPDVTALKSPGDTALSFLTPPAVTKQALVQAKKVGVKAVWLQPGSFGKEEMAFAEENFDSAVGGFSEGTVGGEGWCVLVDGERVMAEAGRDWRTEGKEDNAGGGKL